MRYKYVSVMRKITDKKALKYILYLVYII